MPSGQRTNNETRVHHHHHHRHLDHIIIITRVYHGINGTTRCTSARRRRGGAAADVERSDTNANRARKAKINLDYYLKRHLYPVWVHRYKCRCHERDRTGMPGKKKTLKTKLIIIIYRYCCGNEIEIVTPAEHNSLRFLTLTSWWCLLTCAVFVV